MYYKNSRGLVFIDRVKQIIKLFEESSREDIGIALFAYEQFLCKGLKVNNTDLDRLKKVFNYYDENYSDEYPSLTNEALQNCHNLICNYFGDSIEKDGYRFNIGLGSEYRDVTSFNVEVSDNKNGLVEMNYVCKVNNDPNYKNDSFNTMYKACEEVKKQIDQKDIKSMLDTFTL